MNYQVYGRSGPTGPADPNPDNITITARDIGGNLQISVDGPDPTLNGIYYSGPASNIKSLTIRGTNDNEAIVVKNLALDKLTIDGGGGNDTIQVDGTTLGRLDINGGDGADKIWLGANHILDGLGAVYVDGGSGDDELTFDDSASTGRQYVLGKDDPATGDPGWPMWFGVAGGSLTANMLSVEKVNIFPGTADTVRVDGALNIANGVYVYGNSGDDHVLVGTPQDGLANVTSQVYVAAGDGGANLDILDNGSPAATQYVLGASSKAGYDTAFQVVGNPAFGVYGFGVDEYSIYSGQGDDTVRIDATSSFAVRGTYVYGGAGNDTIIVGTDATGLRDVGWANADQSGPVYVDGGAGAGQLIVKDTDAAAVDNYLYAWGPSDVTGWDARLSREAPSSLTGREKVLRLIYSRLLTRYTLNAGKNDNTIRVDTAPASVTDGCFLNGGAGADSFVVGTATKGLDEIAAPVAVDGGAGANTLTVDNTGGALSDQFTITRAYLARNGGPAIDYASVTNFVLNAGKGGRKNVQEKSRVPGTNYQISFLDGNNQAVFGNDAFALDDLLGPGAIAVLGSGPTDAIAFRDSGYSGGERYTLTAGNVAVGRLAQTPFTYSNIGQLAVAAGGGPDEVDADGLTADVRLSVDGGAGYDTLKILSGAVFDPVLTALEKLDLVDGVLTLNTTPASFADVVQTGGTLGGIATLTATNTLAWSGGTMQGAGTTVATAGSTATLGGGMPTLTRLLDVAGSTTWTQSFTTGRTGTIQNDGTFDGGGWFDGTFVNQGTLRPGGPGAVGAIALGDGFTQGGPGHLAVDLASNPISYADQISVGETANPIALAGSLSVTLLPDFTAVPGTVFTIISNQTGQSINGTFDGLPDGTVFDVGGWRFRINYAQPNPDNPPAGTNHVTLTVMASPRGNPDQYTVGQGNTLSIAAAGVLANDIDPVGHPLTAQLVSGPANGALALNADGSFTYTPASTFFGTDTFQYKPVDDIGPGDPVTVTITVIGKPTASNQSVSVPQNGMTMISLTGTDPNTPPLPLTYTVTVGPSHGTLMGMGSSQTYMPNPGYVGPDSFQFTAANSWVTSDQAVVSINVTDPGPTANPDSATTAAGAPVTVSVLMNDTDPTMGGLTVTGVSTPMNGTATFTAGAVRYTPNPGFSGGDYFTYTITDSHGLTASAGVNVMITPPMTPPPPPMGMGPTANPDSATTTAGVPVTVSVLVNDVDPAGGGLTVTGASAGMGGTTTFTGSTVTYTPGFSGADSFSYTIVDINGATATGTVYVMITPPMIPPPPPPPPMGPPPPPMGTVLTANPDSATTAGETVTVYVVSNDVDPAGGGMSVTAVTAPAHGTATFLGPLVYYTPTAGYSGADSFTYTITDINGATASATVSVMVMPPMTPPPPMGPPPPPMGMGPTANPDSVTTSPGVPVTVSVLTNDLDPAGGGLTVTGVSAGMTGTTTFTGSTVTFTPTTGYSGPDSFTYTITDINGATATGTVYVTILSVTSPPPPMGPPPPPMGTGPTANPDSVTTSPGVPVTVSVLTNDLDPAGGGLTVTGASAGMAGTTTFTATTVTFNPAPGYTGADSFTYTITDINGATATGTVSVMVTSPPPPPVGSGSITGRVWADTNGNGLDDNGETGQSGITIELFDGAGIWLGLTATDATGSYSFTGLASGTYRVKADLPLGYIFTAPNLDGQFTAVEVTTGLQTDLPDIGEHWATPLG